MVGGGPRAPPPCPGSPPRGGHGAPPLPPDAAPFIAGRRPQEGGAAVYSLSRRVEQPGESLRVARGARATAAGVFHLLGRDDFALRAGLSAARAGARRAARAG